MPDYNAGKKFNRRRAPLTGQLSSYNTGLEIGLLKKVTFGLLLKFISQRIFCSKPYDHEKIQLKSWFHMQSNFVDCIGFLYKFVQKTGHFSVFISRFSFPFNFEMANALVLKFGTFPLSCPFSNTLSAIFDICLRLRVNHRFVPRMGPVWHAGVFFHTLYIKSKLKKSRARFFRPQSLLADETKKQLSGKLKVFNLKAIAFGAFSPIFTFLSTLKWYKFSEIVPKHLLFDKLSEKKPFEGSPSGFKISF